jgi:hypothetical protein
MSEGQVYCLDTIRLYFTQDNYGNYNIIEVNSHSFVDLESNMCLCVNDHGLGVLLNVVYPAKEEYPLQL